MYEGESQKDKKKNKKKTNLWTSCDSARKSALTNVLPWLMAKTVGGVVRLEGPLSPDTLPLNAFIITAEGEKKKGRCYPEDQL